MKKILSGRLDEFSKEYPIVLIDGGGHNALCNTVALRKAGLLKENGEKLDNNVLEQEKTNKKDIFNTKVASTWFEGQRVYPK